LFIHAAGDLKHNFFAAFTDATAQWHGLNAFFNDIFVPYLVGSILPGIIAAIACYYLALPIITAYQNRRRAKIKERLTQIRAKLHAKLEAKIEERAERKEERRNPSGLD
jgi:F0F1-type ATP synthase membrane subunit b/b'